MTEEKVIEDEKDVLDEIFVDKNEPVDKKSLVKILKPFVRIDKGGLINYTEDYYKLANIKKALIYLLCKKAMVLKEIENIGEPAGPAEVSKNSFISNSDAKNALCTKYNKLLKKEKEGYIVPNYNLKRVEELILKNGD